jgi:hypothetical protein
VPFPFNSVDIRILERKGNKSRRGNSRRDRNKSRNVKAWKSGEMKPCMNTASSDSICFQCERERRGVKKQFPGFFFLTFFYIHLQRTGTVFINKHSERDQITVSGVTGLCYGMLFILVRLSFFPAAAM